MGKQVIDHSGIKPSVRVGRTSTEPVPRATMQPCPLCRMPCGAVTKVYGRTKRKCDGWQFNGRPFLPGCGHTFTHKSHVLTATNWKSWAREQIAKLDEVL